MKRLYQNLSIKDLIKFLLVLTICGFILSTISITVLSYGLAYPDKINTFVGYSFFIAISICYLTGIVLSKNYLNKIFFKFNELYNYKLSWIKFWYILKLVIILSLSIASVVLMCVNWEALYTNISLVVFSSILFLIFLVDTIQFSMMLSSQKQKALKPIYVY